MQFKNKCILQLRRKHKEKIKKDELFKIKKNEKNNIITDKKRGDNVVFLFYMPVNSYNINYYRDCHTYKQNRNRNRKFNNKYRKT